MNAINANVSSAVDYSLPEMTFRRDEQWFYYENSFIRWRHRADTGELDGAFVLNGSGGNLIIRENDTQVWTYDFDGNKPVQMQRGPSTLVEATPDGIVYEFNLSGKEGEVNVRHKVSYESCGIGRHEVTLTAATPVRNIYDVNIIHMGLTPTLDVMTWRPILDSGISVTTQNATPRWVELHHGTRRQDMLAFRAKRLPLSLLALERGVEGIEFALGDNLDEWNAFRAPGKSAQDILFNYDHGMKGYQFLVAPYHARHDGVIEGSHSFHYNFALPLVRSHMTPFRFAGTLLHYPGSVNWDFEKRWLTGEELGVLRKTGYELLRLHNDGDNFRNNIFWRDADYPPYPPAEMAKMDNTIAAAHSHGINVVPYFSLKEFHPEAPDFAENCENWAKRDERNGDVRCNRFDCYFFGVQMCLKSPWKQKRLDTIRQVLENHAFDGVYFDWCAAQECFGEKHCPYWHWDNSGFTELLLEVRKLCGKSGEMYLHTSNVPSLITENLATLLLTEEVAFPAVGPEMFSPHVHFLNTAPRQICNMLPAGHSNNDKIRLTMAALLHHATVSENSPVVLKVYEQNRYWMDTVTRYRRHHAPGEGWTRTDDERVGFAYYEQEDGKRLAIFANFAETPLTVKWSTPRDGRSGEITVPPLEIVTQLQ